MDQPRRSLVVIFLFFWPLIAIARGLREDKRHRHALARQFFLYGFIGILGAACLSFLPITTRLSPPWIFLSLVGVVGYSYVIPFMRLIRKEFSA